MKTDYERNLQNTWMILEEDLLYAEDYQMRMLKANKLPGFLDICGQGSDGKSLYRYDVTGRASLKNQVEKEKISYKMLRSFMQQLIQALNVVDQYLLDVNHLSLDPEHIYLQGEEFYFCYCPVLGGEIRTSFHSLTEYFVREVDYNDREGIYLSYELHRASMEENYNIEEALEIILERQETEMEKLTPPKEEEPVEMMEEVFLDDWEESKSQGIVQEKQSMWSRLGSRFKKKKDSQWGEWDLD